MSKKSEIQIFLAHANEDQEAVIELYERLKKAGYKPWLDKKDLIPGQKWRSVIPEVIRDSQLFIACLSTRSIARRGFVQKEFRMALNQVAELPDDSIYLIPIRLDECEIPSLRQEEYGIDLRDFHWLDYWEKDAFEKLEKAISLKYGTFAQVEDFSEDRGDGLELEMMAIPGGKFLMGTKYEEVQKLVKKYEYEWFGNERSQHKVTVQPFLIGKYLITQAQYEKVMGVNPSNFKGDQRPVECVSWNDAVEFCQKISETTGNAYRLPSEAEWEYACRVGTTTAYSFGDSISEKLANYGFNIGETTVVGKYLPNNFGLYDMHGNVWEWCQDDKYRNYEDASNYRTARIKRENSLRVLRGGSWKFIPGLCRSAARFYCPPEDAFNIIGFRVACSVPRT
ncbi:MAG: SUMF1/EgtB/PvdO family nonheme iron enzyme [Cyanobacteria bacterium P01_F01_bin.143]